MNRPLARSPLHRWVLSTTLFVACSGGRTPQGEVPVALADRAAALLSRTIQIDTSNPPGNERALDERLANHLESEGIEARVVPLPDASSPRAALWARLPGTGVGRPLILLSHLEAWCRPTRARGSRVRCTLEHVTDDYPAEAIVAAARRNKCDLIFIASHGRHGFRPSQLGSQTHKVLAQSKIPVLVQR